jgi:Protein CHLORORESPIRATORY REDUCTION 7
MTDSLMFQEDEYVVLTTGQAEEIVTAAEMLTKLSETLLNHSDIDFPADVSAKSSTAARAAYLLDNYCELDLGDGRYLHWYAVRLEKN